MSLRARAVVGLAAVAALGLGGCRQTVDRGSIEGKLADDLQQELGTRPVVSCPGDQEAKTGVRFTCTITISGKKLPVDVLMTAKDRFTYKLRSTTG